MYITSDYIKDMLYLACDFSHTFFDSILYTVKAFDIFILQ